jgi:hypothetical protein
MAPSTGMVNLGSFRITPLQDYVAADEIRPRIAKACTLLFEEVLPRDIVQSHPSINT